MWWNVFNPRLNNIRNLCFQCSGFDPRRFQISLWSTEQMGASWHLLGLRLNFSPETLDLIQTSGNNSGADVTNKMAMMMLRAWSQLPTATVGRLATVLWEMGEHAIALQLNP
uniref:Death domain-containing protein n=1 Tax=Timema douglasi TaxID=61478 RepID=A0A7R8VKB5_TIMDO|nr:unnamed protein product [Timema douglasi]